MIRWTLRVDPDIPEDISITKTAQRIQHILDDPRGWRQLGCRYLYVPKGDDCDIIVRIANENTIRKICHFPEKLSCAINGHTILLDKDNFLYGVPKSRLSRNDYVTYVVNHEFGHCYPLFLNHPPNDTCRRSCRVMAQQTRGICHARPSPWPSTCDLQQTQRFRKPNKRSKK